MKILMVSMFINHFFNWVLQLEESGHEVYWIDVSGRNSYVKRIDFVHQTAIWKRKFEYPGRHWIKKNLSPLDLFIEKYNKKEFTEVFQQKLKEIQPDIVHSFELHSSCIPILEIMNKHPKIKWIYSCWGNDLFYYQNDQEKLIGIKAVLSRIDYMFTDCKRDSFIAEKHGFKGENLGAFPGGGGYELEHFKSQIKEFNSRTVILIKGYHHIFGRGNYVLDALLEIKEEIKDFNIVVFGAHPKLLKFVDNPEFQSMKNLTIKGSMARGEILELMGQSLIYIGNSISDGMPNTLLEAIVMEAFPIQSNPGGSTAEIIEHGKNGFLIEDPEDIEEIALLIKQAIKDPELLRSGIAYNTAKIKPMLERNYIKDQVLKKYKLIEQNL